MIWPDLRLSKLSFVLLSALALTAFPACSDESSSSRDDTEEEDPDDELPDEVSQKVGVAGGTVKARGVTLNIPKGALDKDVTITAKRVDREVGKAGGKEAAASKQLSPVYEFGPAGTKFKKEIDVSIERTKEGSDSKKVAMLFTKETNPKEFEVLPSSTKGKETSAKVRHFSQAFLGEPLEEEGGGDGGDGDGPDNGGDGDGDGPDVATETAIVVRSRNSYGVPVNHPWVAFKDGDEPFVQIDSSAEAGVYAFNVKSDLYAVALACPGYSEGTPSVTFVYNTTQTTSVDVEIDSYGCQVNQENSGFEVPLEVQVGQYGSMRLSETDWLGSPQTISGPTHAGYYGVPTTPFDLMVGLGASWDSLEFMSIRRDVTVTSSESSIAIDALMEGAAVTETGTATVTNIGPLGAYTSIAYTSPQARYGLDLTVGEGSNGETTYSTSFAVVPASLQRADDRYTLTSYANEYDYYRQVVVSSSSPTDLSAALPDQFEASFSETSAPATAPYRPLYSFTPLNGASRYSFHLKTYGFNELPGAELLFDVSADWLRATNNLTEQAGQFLVPDLSQLDGLDPSWIPTFEGARDRNMGAGAKGEQESKGGRLSWETSYNQYFYPDQGSPALVQELALR